jgi:hypothetical protein
MLLDQQLCIWTSYIFTDLSSLNYKSQMLRWENLPVLRNEEIYRMPSMGNIFLALTRCNNHYEEGNHMAPHFPAIDPSNTFYLLNPSGDLTSTQKEFEQFFRNYKWKVNEFSDIVDIKKQLLVSHSSKLVH